MCTHKKSARMQRCDDTSFLTSTEWRTALHLLEAVPECYLIISPDFTILTASKAYLEATSVVQKEIVGRNIFEIFSKPGTDQTAGGAGNLNASLHQLLQTRQPHKMEVQQYDFERFSKSAEAPKVKYWRTLNTPVLDEKGKVIYIIHKIVDMTRHLEREEELRKWQQLSENEARRFNEAQAIGHTGSFEWTYPDETLYWSDEMYRIHGLEPKHEISLDESESFVHPDDLNKVWIAITSLLESQQLLDLTYRIKRKDGVTRHVRRISYTIKGENASLLRVHGTVQDITEQVTAKNKIRASERNLKIIEAKLRDLSENRFKDILNAVISAQEEERGRIAEALHNEFGQLLSIAKLKIASEPVEATELLNQAIVEVRNISYELMPPMLEDFGLELALKDMISRKLLGARIRYKNHITGLKERIDRLMEVAVYRIIQELLNNIVKHSKADFVEICITTSPDIFIQLTDNGVGFNPGKYAGLNEKGFGLTYITNRVHLLKGTIDFKKGLARGTVVEIKLPRATIR